MPLFDHFKILAPIYEIFIKPKQPENLMARLGLTAWGPALPCRRRSLIKGEKRA